MGPYDEPKAWAMVTLVGLTAVAWVAGRVLGRAAMPSVGPDRALRAVRWILVVYGRGGVWPPPSRWRPGQSFWGVFGRGFGLTCFLAVSGCFSLVQAEVRTLEGACHLVDRRLLGALPVIALALGQALGWDPFPPGGTGDRRHSRAFDIRPAHLPRELPRCADPPRTGPDA